jgi:hypothetical protein
MGALEANGAWTEPMELPPGERATPTKSLLTKQIGAGGEVVRYIAGLVYQRNNYTSPSPDEDVYSPASAVSKEAMKMFLPVAASNSTYVGKLLKRFAQLGRGEISHGAPTPGPMISGMKFDQSNNNAMVDKDNYRSIVAALLYLLTLTRPNVVFAVSTLSRYSDCPGNQLRQCCSRCWLKRL